MNKEFSEIIGGFKKAWSLISPPERFSLIIASILMAVAGTLTNLPALILGHLVDQLVSAPRIDFSLALPFIGLIIVIILVREFLTVVRKYLIENVATQTDKKETVAVISHLLKTDISFLNETQIGSLNGKIFRSVQGLIRLIKLSFLEFAPSVFSALAAIGIALFQKPLLASVMILVIPTGLFIIIKQISSQKGIRVMLIRGKEKIDGTVVETLGGIETVRVLNTTDLEVKKVEIVAEELRAKEIKHHIFMALFDSVKYLNEGFFYILVISLSILLAAQGSITKGDILVYSILFTSILNPLREIHRILDQAHEASINVSDLSELLTEPVDVSFKTPNHIQPISKNSVIEIKNLSFSYNRNSGGILKDIDLTIKKGEKIGIAGASGCGKTTLIKILLRLIHNYHGQIDLLGQDLQLISREEIADKIAYVPQKTYIFSGTIKDNLTYGTNAKITEDQIINAAKKANIWNEIEKELGGLNGKVTENGNNLSGGQKQRLALSRLILKSPEILIFDEATSALDNTNEAKIQYNLEELFKDKTTITIAHRLTTLKNSDRILVFDKGKIAQEGKYQDLAKQNGLFQDFLTQKPL
jgi:ATP-binding cassette, subfamily B, bacterial